MSNLLHVLYKRMTLKRVKANASYVPVVFVQGLGKNSNCSIALNLTLCYCYTFQTVSEGQTPGYHFRQFPVVCSQLFVINLPKSKA